MLALINIELRSTATRAANACNRPTSTHTASTDVTVLAVATFTKQPRVKVEVPNV